MSKSCMPYAFFGGNIVPLAEASVSIASNSLQYGTTCFAGIRGYVREKEARIFRLKDHYIRLMNASKILSFEFFLSFEEFSRVVKELVLVNAPKGDFYIRPFIFSRDLELSPRPKGLTFELAIYLLPLGHYFDPNQGLKLMISSWRKFNDASLSTKAKAGGCYVNSFLASGEAMRAGYDEALLLDENGFVVEASAANILVVYRDRILTPGIGSALLEGITLRSAIQLLKDDGITVEFGSIDRSLIYSANELILTGTAAQFTFASSVDGRTIGIDRQSLPGPVCSLLRSKFASIIEKQDPKSEEWLTSLEIS